MEPFILKILKKILDFLKPEKISSLESREQTLFDTAKYDRPGYVNYKKCPHCEKEAYTNHEAERIFGIMTVKGHRYIQSWCRECRKGQKTEAEKSSEGDNLFLA